MRARIRTVGLIIFTFLASDLWGQDQKTTDQKFEALYNQFFLMEENVQLRTESTHTSKFNLLIDDVKEAVESNGTDEQKALLAFIRYEQLGWSSSTDVYERLLVGSQIWALRNSLPVNRMSIALNRLASLYDSTKQLDMLLMVSKEKCRLQQSGTDGKCVDLAGVYHRLKQFDKALELYRLSVENAEQKKDTFMVGVYYNNIGLAYLQLQKKDSATWAFNKALETFLPLGDNVNNRGPFYIRHYRNVVEWNLLEMEGGISQRQVVIAKELIYGGRKFIEWNWVMNGFELLANHHFQQNRFKLAESYADSAISQARIAHSPEREIDLLELKAKILFGSGQLVEGETTFEKANALADSLKLVDADLSASIAAAEFREKEREIELTNTQQEAKEERQQRITTSVLLAAALIILLLMVVFYIQSRKSAKVISSQKEKLATSLAEKEVLLKEIHHRVKNNLQVVSNMLDLGTFTETDPKLVAVLTEAKDRIKTMALIHTNLYQHDDLSAIKFEGYLNDLLRGLADTYFDRKKKVTWHLNAGEDLLDIDTAVPVGLIVNELVSNAFKYAFQEKEEGRIEVDFKKQKNLFHLIVKDDGPGLPEDFEPEKSKSLGLRIVLILVKQLEGEMNIFRNNGTQFHITFKPLEQRRQESR